MDTDNIERNGANTRSPGQEIPTRGPPKQSTSQRGGGCPSIVFGHPPLNMEKLISTIASTERRETWSSMARRIRPRSLQASSGAWGCRSHCRERPTPRTGRSRQQLALAAPKECFDRRREKQQILPCVLVNPPDLMPLALSPALPIPDSQNNPTAGNACTTRCKYGGLPAPQGCIDPWRERWSLTCVRIQPSERTPLVLVPERQGNPIAGKG